MTTRCLSSTFALTSRFLINSILLLALSTSLLAIAPRTSRAELVFDLNTAINGAVPGDLRATFTTVAPGTVTLTMESFGASNEFLNGWGFNINPTYDFSANPLGFAFQIGSSTGAQAAGISTGHDHTNGGNQYKAGQFDIFFQFPATGSGDRFDGGEKVVYSITGDSITEDFFNFATTDDGDMFGGPYLSAADVKGLPGSLSGSIGTAVPEPTSLIMFATVVGLCGVRRRRK